MSAEIIDFELGKKVVFEKIDKHYTIRIVVSKIIRESDVVPVGIIFDLLEAIDLLRKGEWEYESS